MLPRPFSSPTAEVKMYEPKVDRVMTYKTGKNRAEVESFLVLGFGGRGHDLLKSYDVKYIGQRDPSTASRAFQLELIPKSEKAHNQFSQIFYGSTGKTGVSVQQKLVQPSGDYRLAKYSKIVINQKLPDGVFKLKGRPRKPPMSPRRVRR